MGGSGPVIMPPDGLSGDQDGHLPGWPMVAKAEQSCCRAQSTVDCPVGGHVNVLSDYKETGLEKNSKF